MRAQAFDFSFSLQLHREKKQQREFCASFKEELDREEDKVKRRRRTYVCLNVWVNSSYPSRALGGFCVLKRRNFEFESLFFYYRRKKGKNQTSSEAQTNAQKLSKREVKREIRGVCAFSVFAHQNTLRRFGLRAYTALLLLLFPQHIKAFTLCAHDERSQ
jgi:hypothetical protein